MTGATGRESVNKSIRNATQGVKVNNNTISLNNNKNNNNNNNNSKINSNIKIIEDKLSY